MLNRIPKLFVVLMLMLTLWALKPSVTDSEAWWLWVVRDVVDVQPAAPSDVLRGARDNLSSAIDRGEGGLNIPFAAILEGWTWLAGDSLEALRWGGVLLISVSAAVVIRMGTRYIPRSTLRGMSIFVVLLPALIFLQPIDRIGLELRNQQNARESLSDPVLTFFSESSPLGYYQHRYNLRAGIGIDLGWREFTTQEIIDITDKLDPSRPIWVISSTHDHPAVYTLVGYLTDNGRQIPFSMSFGDALTVMQFR